MSTLPYLPAGVWRHWKGGLYQTLGFAQEEATGDIVVVYIGLQLDGAHDGPRMRTRVAHSTDPDVNAWYDLVYKDGTKDTGQASISQPICRFEYLGAEWRRE
jgi:hypothetical protein